MIIAQIPPSPLPEPFYPKPEELNNQPEVENTSDFLSFQEVLHAENPAAAYAELATDPVKTEGFLRDSEYEVAKAAADLELGLRLGSEKETFDAAVRQHVNFLGLKIMHEVRSFPGETKEGLLNKHVIDTILASEESILTLENDIRIDNSMVERGKEIVASNKIRRFIGQVALAGTSVVFTSLSIKYGAQMLPRDAEEMLHDPTNLVAATSAGTLVAQRTLSRWFGDKLSESGAESLDEYTPVGTSVITERKLFKIHQKQIAETRHALQDITINKYHSDGAGSTEMVAELLTALRDQLLDAYEAEDVKEVKTVTKKGALSASKAFGAGLAALLGMNEVAAEQLFANVPLPIQVHSTARQTPKHKA